MSIRQAVILCGGKGERLGDALRYSPTVVIPKPLIEVGGKPFITYAINMLKGIGFEDIVLLCRHLVEHFKFLSDETIRVIGIPTSWTLPESMAKGDISEEVLSVPNLQDIFLLLNSDSFPLMDWRAFVNTEDPRVAVKMIGRDAGVAIVSKWDVKSGVVRCLDIKGMMDEYENYVVLGGLHIGTPQGLQRARAFIDIAVYGQ